VKAGSYILTCVLAADSPAKAVFSVRDPEGYALPDSTEATAYVNSQINFAIAEGLTPFIVGDYFTIATTNGGLFSVVNPEGVSLPNASVGVAYVSGQINFTINDGSTDFAVGDYFTVLVGNAGLWSVRDPEGNRLPDAKTGVAYVNGQINFTINDGSTDFVVGDSFTITVAAGNGQYKLSLAAAVDGSQNMKTAAVLAQDTDASNEIKTTIAYIAGDFYQIEMTLGQGHTAASVKEALEQRGIYLKDTLQN
jgi:hypothetical protein